MDDYPNGLSVSQVIKIYREPSIYEVKNEYQKTKRVGWVRKVRNIDHYKTEKIIRTLNVLKLYGMVEKNEFRWKWKDEEGKLHYSLSRPEEIPSIRLKKPLWKLTEKAKQYKIDWGMFSPPWLIFRVLIEHGYFKPKSNLVEISDAGKLIEQFET